MILIKIYGCSGPRKIDYDQAYGLYERLNDTERNFLAPHGNYVDSKDLLLRMGYVDDEKCCAFCDVYTSALDPDTKSGGAGVLTVAVDPTMRGRGLGYYVSKAAIDAASKFGISHFIYRVDKKNEPSIGLAKKLGGQIEREDNTIYKFKIL